MEMANTLESDDTLWQGYVSAISCLLLALLLLMAILSISLVLASSAEKAQAELQTQLPAAPDPRSEATANPANSAKTASPAKPTHPANGARWVINFPGQTVDIGSEQLSQFAAQLMSGKTDGAWQVFAYSHAGDAIAQRLAYIRVLAVRDLLVESGIAANNIELQLLGTDSSPSNSKGTHSTATAIANTTNSSTRAMNGLVYVKHGRLPEPANAPKKGQP